MITDREYERLRAQYNDLLNTNDDLLKALNKATDKKYDIKLKELEFKKQQYKIKIISMFLIAIIYIVFIIAFVNMVI